MDNKFDFEILTGKKTELELKLLMSAIKMLANSMGITNPQLILFYATFHPEYAEAIEKEIQIIISEAFSTLELTNYSLKDKTKNMNDKEIEEFYSSIILKNFNFESLADKLKDFKKYKTDGDILN